MTPDITLRHACFNAWSNGAIAENPGPAGVARPLIAFPAGGGIAVRCSHQRPGPFVITVLDVAGRDVGRYQPSQPGGTHDWFWPASVSGIYFVKLTASELTATGKVSVLK